MRSLPGTVLTKTGMIPGHLLWHTTCPEGDAIRGAVCNAAHREGCCLRTHTAATVSETKRLQVIAVEGTDRRELNLNEREQVHHAKQRR